MCAEDLPHEPDEHDDDGKGVDDESHACRVEHNEQPNHVKENQRPVLELTRVGQQR